MLDSGYCTAFIGVKCYGDRFRNFGEGDFRYAQLKRIGQSGAVMVVPPGKTGCHIIITTTVILNAEAQAVFFRQINIPFGILPVIGVIVGITFIHPLLSKFPGAAGLLFP